MLDALDVT